MRRSKTRQAPETKKATKVSGTVCVLAGGTMLGFGALLAPRVSASVSFDQLVGMLHGSAGVQHVAQDQCNEASCADSSGRPTGLPCNCSLCNDAQTGNNCEHSDAPVYPIPPAPCDLQCPHCQLCPTGSRE